MPRKNGSGPPKGSTGPRDGRGGGKGRNTGKGVGGISVMDERDIRFYVEHVRR